MIGWLSWLFDRPAAGDEPEAGAPDELRELKARRRQLIESMDALRAHGFERDAEDDQAALRSLERRIQTLQLKSDAGGGRF